MIFYPDEYLENVKKISIELLEKNNIKALILDVDNTLIDFYKNMPEGTTKWCNDLKQKGIKFCILSNSNNIEKVEKVAKELDIKYFYLAAKPFKRGFKKAIKYLEEDSKNIAAVGDQIFTDVIGANRCKMFSILVKPIKEKDLLITKIKRPLENFVINKYLKNLRKEENKNVHK